MPGLRSPLVLAAALALTMGVRGQNPSGRLDFSDSVRMVDCDPASTVPCFRLKFNIVDSQGAPMPAQLPSPEKLAENISVQVDQQAITPFFASTSGEKQAVRGRVALVIVDISGSMNRKLATGQTRFEAAKAALSSFLDGFQDGIDRVAVVPFESHHVESSIRAARFATSKQDALQQVQALPVPEAHNNTALYSAVALGIDVMQQELAKKTTSAISPETMIILMTDGKNEVFKGDDAGLLDGPAGLTQASSKVRASGLQVIGVGFGDPKDIDETALRELSTKYYMTADAANLTKIFTVARTLLSSRIQATFASPWPDRASLAGRTLRISVKLKLANSQELVSAPTSWATPQMGVPLFEGHCDTDEMKALYHQTTTSTGDGWISILRPVLVFVGLGVLLLVLWFWVPRLVWPEQYIGIVPTKRWAGQPSAGRAKNAPPGFDEANAGQQAPRAAFDKTVVAPRPDFTKTRLGPPPPGRWPRS